MINGFVWKNLLWLTSGKPLYSLNPKVVLVSCWYSLFFNILFDYWGITGVFWILEWKKDSKLNLLWLSMKGAHIYFGYVKWKSLQKLYILYIQRSSDRHSLSMVDSFHPESLQNWQHKSQFCHVRFFVIQQIFKENPRIWKKGGGIYSIYIFLIIIYIHICPCCFSWASDKVFVLLVFAIGHFWM